MAINHDVEQKTSRQELARSMDMIFKELKFATGQEKVSHKTDKKGIYLTQIMPEYPVLNRLSILTAYPDFCILIPYKNVFFQSHEFPPEQPPPEILFVC